MSSGTRDPATPMDVESAAGIWAALRAVPGHTYRVFIICLVGVTFANLDHSLFTFVLTELSAEFGWSELERGLYIALTFVVAGILITQIGVLADRIGRRAVLLGATLLTPVFVTALAWAPTTVTLLIARTLGFTSAAVQSPITGTLVLEESPPRLRGLFTGVLQIGFPLGFFLASLLVPFIYETWGWRYIFLLSLLFLPYAWVIWRYLKDSEAWQRARASRRASSTPPPAVRELFRPAYRRKTILLFLGTFLYVFAYGATIMLTPYFRESRGWDAREAIELVGLSFFIGAFGYILAAWFGEFLISRRNTIVAWCWLGGLAFGVMIWFTKGWWPTFLAFSTMTFFFYGAYAVMFTFIAENFPAELRATAASFANSFAVELGLGLGPFALSWAIGRV
ncbi:MAG: MFS transporter, partial [Gammaproteobacteria bacterium]|nr:MFS transporter [Gammaproteobacteria bacterium]